MNFRNGIIWITSLSLDAPLVAIAWQNAVATQHATPLQWHHRALVFLSVWLGYSADRWFDAWRHDRNLSQRHRLHATHRWPLFALWLLILAGSFALAFRTLELPTLLAGSCLALSAIVVTLVVQSDRLRHFQSIAKTVLTALLVTASVLLFTTTEFSRETLSSAFILFTLFSLNCAFIHHWDHSIDAVQEPHRNDQPRLAILGAAFSLNLISIAFAFGNTSLAPFLISSTMLLALIHAARKKLNPETKRTLADLALLTPFFGLL